MFPSIAVVLAWAGGSAGGDIKRGVALAMTIGMGNLGGVCSSFIYRAVDSPQFHPGHGTVIGCLLLSYVVFISFFFFWLLRRPENEKPDVDVLTQVLHVMHYDDYVQATQ